MIFEKIETIYAAVGKTNVKKGKHQVEEEVENFQEEELIE